MIKQEFCEYSSEKRKTEKHVTAKNVENFSWGEIMKEAEQVMPTLVNSLRALVMPNGSSTEKSLPGLGAVICQLLYLKSPRKYTFLQECNSVQL